MADMWRIACSVMLLGNVVFVRKPKIDNEV